MASGRRRGTNFLVGLLTLVAVGILAVVAGFLLEKENPLRLRVEIQARFSNVAGLKAGDSVTLSGSGIGSVAAIYTSPPSDRWEKPGYLVVLQIDDRPEVRQWIREDSKFQIVNDNLFGNRRVEISFGTEGEPVESGAQVEGEVVEGIGAIGSAVEDIAAVAAELRVFVLGDGGEQAPISASLENLRSTLENTAVVSAELRDALEGDQAADMERTLKDLQVSAENLREITTSLRETGDSIGRTWEKITSPSKWFSADDEEGEGEEMTEGEEGEDEKEEDEADEPETEGEGGVDETKEGDGGEGKGADPSSPEGA